MARHERDIHAGGREPLSLNQLLELLSGDGEIVERDRQHAIACYLAGGEGWREAVEKIGGAFAGGGTGLKERKSD